MMSAMMNQWMMDLNQVNYVIYGLDRNTVTTWETKKPVRSGPDSKISENVLNTLNSLIEPLLETEYYDSDIYDKIKDDTRIKRPDGRHYTQWTIQVYIRKMREKHNIRPPKPESKKLLGVANLLKEGKSKKEIMKELDITYRYLLLLSQQARKKGLL